MTLSESRDPEEPGFYRGRYYSDWVETVKKHKRAGRLDDAVELLGHLVVATEAEARVKGWGVAPWYYEQLAIIYGKRREPKAVLSILGRYERQPHAPGSVPERMEQRLAKARKGRQ